MPCCYFGGSDIRIGDDCFVNRSVFFDNSEAISVGNGCSLGMEVLLLTSDHEIGEPGHRAGAQAPKPILVGNGVWIGARATLMPGVTVGDGAIIGAGSLVTRDVPSNVLCVGVPAKVLRPLDIGGADILPD